MNPLYPDVKASEALRLHEGNKTKASKQMREWLYEDHKLLLDITAPYITGIIAHALSRAEKMSMNEGVETAEQQRDPLDKLVNTGGGKLGKEVLRSYASQQTARFGLEATSGVPPLRNKAASQKHIDTIHLLAAKAKNKAFNPNND